ncbi:MAG: hypothetical protein WAV55_11660 [Clostridiaceae bacterium]
MGIGRKVRLLTDSSRVDFYSGEPVRRIPISIFYPTKQEGSSYYKDLYDPFPEMLVKIYGEGKRDQIDYLNNLKAEFMNKAKPDSAKAHPVIVFSHGLEADRDFYLFLIEPLVNDGYIVVTTGHLYDTDVTLLPDGEVIKMKDGLLGEASFEQRTAQIETRGLDMTFVVDHLAELNREPDFTDLLDLNRVALCGHSLGGMTVLKTLAHPLVKAGVLLDAALRLIDVDQELLNGQTIHKPVLNFRRGAISYGDKLSFRIEKLKDKSCEKFKETILKEHEDALAEEVSTRKTFQYVNGEYKNFIYLDKSIHMTFCDWFTLVPDKYYPTLIPIEEAHRMISQVVLAFYRENLLKEEKPYSDLIYNSSLQGIHMEQISMG